MRGRLGADGIRCLASSFAIIMIFLLHTGTTSAFLQPRLPLNLQRAGAVCKTSEVKGQFAPLYHPFLQRSSRLSSRHVDRLEMKSMSVEAIETRASMLQDLIAKKDINIYVRDAKGLDGTFVAQLRCMAFDLDGAMFRSQRRKLKCCPHYFLAGIYHTTFLVSKVCVERRGSDDGDEVAVARAVTERGQLFCKVATEEVRCPLV
eukprot:753345-Hanusia_phi.AAC.1